MNKKLLFGGGAVFAAILVGFFVFRSMDHLIGAAIEKYGSAITGVPVRVSGVHLDLAKAKLTIRHFSLGNPSGYMTPEAIAVDQFEASLDVSTLSRKVVHLREVLIRGPSVDYESRGGVSNFDQIQKNVNEYLKIDPASSSSSSREKKLVIDHLSILNARVMLTAPLLKRPVVAPMPNIQLYRLGEASNGATAAAITQQVLASFTQNIAKVLVSVATGAVRGAIDGIGKGLHGIFR